MEPLKKETLLAIQKRLKISPNWNEWELLKSFYYDIGWKWSWKRIRVPKGFITDWASIPRIFHILWTPMDTDTIIWAVIHDFLYSNKKLTRQETDEIFNEIMLLTGVSHPKRILYFLWVRIGGWYKRNKLTLNIIK